MSAAKSKLEAGRRSELEEASQRSEQYITYHLYRSDSYQTPRLQALHTLLDQLDSASHKKNLMARTQAGAAIAAVLLLAVITMSHSLERADSIPGRRLRPRSPGSPKPGGALRLCFSLYYVNQVALI